MEAAMRMELGAKHTYRVERLFGDLRKSIRSGGNGGQVSAIAESVRVAMRRDAALLDRAGIPLEVFKVNQ
jgi:fumarate hydratase class II/high-affinity iron transporter